MAGRRILYTLSLAGTMAFYWASRNWLSAVLVLTAVFLPWLSLILTLPAIIGGKGQLQCPSHVTAGTPAKVCLSLSSRFPPPPISGKLRLTALFTEKSSRVKPGTALPTSHCGAFRVRCRFFWAADYMGLIRLPVFLGENRLVLVRPAAVKPEQLPDINRYLNTVTRPKAGGGYSEIHELREYRPGDNLRQIHWKLSAKTGDLIVREPMEARQDAVILTMALRGTPDALDQKLGRLLGTSSLLAENNIRHRIVCYTGTGMVSIPVSSEQEAVDAIDALLQQPLASDGDVPPYPNAAWRHHIGGGADGE